MKVIGITGSSGSGKSTVCDILKREYNVKIIDADKIAKQLSKKGTGYLNDIVKEFGENILDEKGELDRKKLANIIYRDSEKRNKLNNCTFKYIKNEIEREIKEENGASTIVIDAPLLFECKLENMCESVIGVISNKNMQITRIMSRDGINCIEAEKRLDSQQTNEFYIEKCDEIIENNGNIDDIKNKVKKIVEKCNITKKLH